VTNLIRVMKDPRLRGYDQRKIAEFVEHMISCNGFLHTLQEQSKSSYNTVYFMGIGKNRERVVGNVMLETLEI
jgi:hypothetical protein